MAKCLYGALFDWIVLKVNHALLAKRHHSEHKVSVSYVKTISCLQKKIENKFVLAQEITVLTILKC